MEKPRFKGFPKANREGAKFTGKRIIRANIKIMTILPQLTLKLTVMILKWWITYLFGSTTNNKEASNQKIFHRLPLE